MQGRGFRREHLTPEFAADRAWLVGRVGLEPPTGQLRSVTTLREIRLIGRLTDLGLATCEAPERCGQVPVRRSSCAFRIGDRYGAVGPRLFTMRAGLRTSGLGTLVAGGTEGR